MSVPQHNVIYTYEEYVGFENGSGDKHEFLNGQIYAIAGSTAEHAALVLGVGAQLYQQLADRECHAYSSDLRVRTNSGLSTYPDVAVVCGSPEYDRVDRVAVTNPTLIVEVLSRSTEEYDRNEKFEHYKTLSTFRQYVLVSYRERSIQVWTREGGAWRSVTFGDGEIADLSLIGAQIDVRRLYAVAERST